MNESKHIHESYIERLKETEDSLEVITADVNESNERMRLLTSEQENIDEEKEK